MPCGPAIIKETFPLSDCIDPFFLFYAKNVTFCDFTGYHLSRDYVQRHSFQSVFGGKTKVKGRRMKRFARALIERVPIF